MSEPIFPPYILVSILDLTTDIKYSCVSVCMHTHTTYLHPATVHSIVATSRHKNSEPQYQCPMIVPFSQQQRIDQKRFRGLFRIPMTLQPPPPHTLYSYVVVSNATLFFFPKKLFHGSYFLRTFLPLL